MNEYSRAVALGPKTLIGNASTLTAIPMRLRYCATDSATLSSLAVAPFKPCSVIDQPLG
jgi:hypothetical protein